MSQRTYRFLLLLLLPLLFRSPALAQLPSDSPSTEEPPGASSTAGPLVSTRNGSSEGAPPSAVGTTLPSGTAQLPPSPGSASAVPPPTDTPARASGSDSVRGGSRSNGLLPPDLALPAPKPDRMDNIGEPGDYPRLTPEEYTYADRPRYTLSGKLPYRETHLKTGTAVAFGGALLALAGSITWYQQAWYPDSTKAPFHLQTDWGYSKQFDKAGHMFGGWMSAYCSYESFVACGLSPDDAALWGSIGGLFFQTFMEVQDGFFSYGFDPTDELSNLIGAGYFYAQQKVPFLQNLDPKWSVGPNPRDSAREAAQIRSRILMDDYDRQDVWLSVRVHNLLPENLKPWWPKWLQLALGAGARDVELVGYSPHRELHLSLDYNLTELFPDMGSFGNWLVQGLNHFHLPAPALRLWPSVKFELLYPFHL